MSNEPTKHQPPNDENRSSAEAARAKQRPGSDERQQQQAALQRRNEERGADTADATIAGKSGEENVETGVETPSTRISVGP